MADEEPKASPVVPRVHPMMAISGCISNLLQGKSMRRMEWEDPEVFVVVKDEKVMIYKPETKKLHPLIISTGDLTATDWITAERRKPDEKS